MEAKIKEIFTSIQGEGPFAGYKQLFIRFCGCNLNCNYCDTNFRDDDAQNFTPDELLEKITNDYDLNSLHSVSLTGGEPLLNSEFLLEFLPKIQKYAKIYLETNATLSNELLKIKQYIDIISADIKLPSSTGKNTFELHEEFIKNCKNIYTFAKIVFNENITDFEIETCIEIAKNNDIELILQPEMKKDKMAINSEFCNIILDKFISKYKKTRLIPQIHKFLNIE